MDNFGYKIIEDTSDEVHALVYNSALKSLRRTPPFNLVRDTVFFSRLHDLLEHWLKNGRLYLAVALDDPDVVYGWAVTCGNVLGYVYVKQSHRGDGMGTDLATEAVKGVLGAGKGVEKRVFYQLSTSAFDKFLDQLALQLDDVVFSYSIPSKLRDRRVDKNRILDRPVKSGDSDALQGKEAAQAAQEVA